MRELFELEVVLNMEALSVYSSGQRPTKLFFTSFILNTPAPTPLHHHPNNHNCSKLVEN